MALDTCEKTEKFVYLPERAAHNTLLIICVPGSFPGNFLSMSEPYNLFIITVLCGRAVVRPDFIGP